MDNQKQSILHQAARRNSLKILKLIIEDSNILKTLLKLKDEEGNTALHLACEEIHEDAVLLLIKCGADLNEKNANKKTPLQLCSPEFKKLIESKTAK